MFLVTTNQEENFKIEFGQYETIPNNLDPPVETFYILIKDTKTEEIRTAEFLKLEDAKEVYCNFINWSIKGMHTFEQRVMLLKELEEYYNKTKLNSRNEK